MVATSELEDREALSRLASKDGAALRLLARRHGPALSRYLERLVGKELAKDALQETLLVAFNGASAFRGEASVKSWLFTIARNVFLRSRERGQRETTLDDDQSAVAEAAQAQESWVRGGLDPILDRADLGPAINRALGDLPESFRSVVVLVDVEDQPYEAAADVLGIPVGTVRSRLFRGRKLLQVSLAQHARDVGLLPARHSGSSA